MKDLRNTNRHLELFEFDNNEKTQKTSLGFILNSFDCIIGADEAGRGPGAGGVWAAAVCFFDDIDKNLFLELNDSKKLTPKKREELFEPIKNNSYYSIQTIDVEEIEKINILNASLLCIEKAILDVKNKIGNKKFIALIDGNKLTKNSNYAQKCVIKGDSKSASIAAASILAKVTRDRYMEKIDKIYPQYDWKNNKGYLSKTHIDAIKKYGITKFHRISYLKNINYKNASGDPKNGAEAK